MDRTLVSANDDVIIWQGGPFQGYCFEYRASLSFFHRQCHTTKKEVFLTVWYCQRLFSKTGRGYTPCPAFHRQCRWTIERSIPILPLWIAARVSHSNTKESNQFLNSIFCMGHKMLEKYLKKHFVCFISTRCHSKAFMAVCSLANWTEIFVPQSQKSFPFVQIILKLVTLHPSFDTRDLLPTKKYLFVKSNLSSGLGVFN